MMMQQVAAGVEGISMIGGTRMIIILHIINPAYLLAATDGNTVAMSQDLRQQTVHVPLREPTDIHGVLAKVTNVHSTQVPSGGRQ